MQQMTCPKCHGDMRSYERSGVTLEQCTDCRGIFLDRGELERLGQAETAYNGGGHQSQSHSGGHDSHDSRGHDSYSYGGQKHHKKHKNFMEELFD